MLALRSQLFIVKVNQSTKICRIFLFKFCECMHMLRPPINFSPEIGVSNNYSPLFTYLHLSVGKYKFVPVPNYHTVKTYHVLHEAPRLEELWSGGIAPHILNLGTKWR